MGQPPHVDGVSHRRVSARGLEFHVAEAGSVPTRLLVGADDAVIRPVLIAGYEDHAGDRALFAAG